MLDENVVTIVYHLPYAWVTAMSEYQVNGDSPFSGWLIKDGRVICIVKMLLIIAYTLVSVRLVEILVFKRRLNILIFLADFRQKIFL